MLEIADMKKSFIDVPEHIAVSVYFQGCTINCPGCHNPELHEFKKGRMPIEGVLSLIHLSAGLVDAVALMGGEPLDQDIDSLVHFIKQVQHMGVKTICLYTGYPLEEIPKKVLDEVNMVKYGRYGEPQVYKRRVKKMEVKSEWEVFQVEV